MLTREEILAMPAGRELDALIAEQVCGWYQSPSGDNGFQIYSPSDNPGWPKCYGWARNDQPRLGDRQPEYSTSIAAAWLVVEQMRQIGFWSMHTDLSLDSGTEWWSWHFNDHASPGNHSVTAQAETVPLAVCRCALLALAHREDAAAPTTQEDTPN